MHQYVVLIRCLYSIHKVFIQFPSSVCSECLQCVFITGLSTSDFSLVCMRQTVHQQAPNNCIFSASLWTLPSRGLFATKDLSLSWLASIASHGSFLLHMNRWEAIAWLPMCSTIEPAVHTAWYNFPLYKLLSYHSVETGPMTPLNMSKKPPIIQNFHPKSTKKYINSLLWRDQNYVPAYRFELLVHHQELQPLIAWKCCPSPLLWPS